MTEVDIPTTFKQIVKFGLDKDGFYGLICSSDNGETIKLIVGPDGLIFYPEDGEKIWNVIKNQVKDAIASETTWAKLSGKPNVALKSDLDDVKTTIDTNDDSTIKKPSDYSEGFSYEQKSVSATGLDQSNFTGSALSTATLGLLTSKTIISKSVKYVRQRFEVLDSDYPYTFERNGTGDTWYPWHGVTVWD